jgi:hypothetical protein
MEICSNCLRSKSGDHLFCPWCGYPTGSIGLKRCGKGHVIYETHKNCVFCEQSENIGKSVLNSRAQERTPTEFVQAPGSSLDATVMESDTGPGPTVVEDDESDKTVLEDYDDKTRLDDDIQDGKTFILQQEEKTAPFYAWLVQVDEDGLPQRDIRLTKEKSIIGKGDDADIHVTDGFVSKLHALVYFEKDVFYLSDLGSTNGTFLNNQVIIKEPLKDGDRIRTGHQNMIFKRVIREIS